MNAKQLILRALEVCVVVATVAAAALALSRPECTEHMLAEVARGVGAGLLFAAVKVLTRISRSKLVCEPMSCWWCYGWAVARHEFRAGLLGGFLLGLLLALGHYARH